MSSNLSFSSSTSERYALALYELAKEKLEIDKTTKEVNSLKEVLIKSEDFKNMVSNPTIARQDQEKAIEKISEYLNFSSTFKKFLGLLTSKGRLFFLHKIINSFQKLVSINKGELIAELFSSKELSVSEINSIQKDLSADLDRTLKINYIYDPDLIGGFMLKIESIMIDTSIKNKLKRLEKLMRET